MTVDERPDLAAHALRIYRRDMQAHAVPGHLTLGLSRYLVHHIRPGGFLSAVLSGDIPGALARADDVSAAGFGNVCLFLFKCAPSDAWGNVEKFEAWLAGDLPKPKPDAHLGAVGEHGGER